MIQNIIKHKKVVVQSFHALDTILVGALMFVGYLVMQDINSNFVHEIGHTSGTIAAIFFILTLLPGIARRFNIQHGIFTILMLFRRQTGTTMFLFGLLHYSSLRLFPLLFAGVPLDLSPPVFEILGFFALYSLIPLYITSNDYSVKKLGKWWRRVHSIAYISVWLIFTHVALQEFEGVAIVLGLTAILEVASLIYHRRPSA